MRHFCALAFVTAATLITSGPLAHSAEVVLRLGHPVLEAHPYHDAAVRFRDAVQRRTNGEVEIQIFPSRQLGDARELYDGVNFGTVDVTFSDVSAFPPLKAMQFPWLIETYEHLAEVVELPETRAMLQAQLPDNLELLTIYEAGRMSFVTVDREVSTIDDFSGLKTRVPPVPMHLEIWAAIGTNPTPIPYGELYTALETGTIDALGTNVTSILSEKFYEVANRVVLTKHHFWPAMLLVNGPKFNSLKPEYQEALRAAAAETTEAQIMAIAASEDNIIEQLKGLGVIFTEMSDDLRADLEAAVEPVIENHIDAHPTIRPFVEAAERTKPE